jgi:cobalt-zinc-cadmium resistance protein CzcA
MRTRKTLPLIIVLMALTSLSYRSSAQETKRISVDDAVKMALDNNLQIKSSALTVDMQTALKGASWDIGKTSLGYEHGQINSFTKDDNITITQTISFPTVYINQARLAGANIKSSEFQLKGSQLEIATQVKQVYWQLAYLYTKYRLLIYQDSLFTGFSRAAELRAKSGETNRLEMITARSQSLEVRNRMHQVFADIGIVSRKFRTLLNSDINIMPADTILRKAGTLQATDSMAIKQNPNLGYMVQQVEISHLQRALELSHLMPDISIGYFNQSMIGTQDVNGVPRSFGAGDRFSGVQAGITIPLWFVPYSSKAKAAGLSEKAAATQAEYFSKSLTGEYFSLLDEYKKYSESVEYYIQQAVPEAELIIDQSTRSYKAGVMDYLDYILNLNRGIEIKQNYLDALNGLNQTILNIEFITGKTL